MSKFENNVIDISTVPVPETKNTTVIETKTDMFDFEQDDIIAYINSRDENNLCPCYIFASLELYKDVTKEMTLADIPEENKTVIDDMEINDCYVETFTMDGELLNVVFTFDSEKNAYLHELKRLLDRYRLMQEEIVSNSDANDKLPVFSLTFMPKALEGRGVMQVTFPIAYFRTLDDAGLNVSMHMMYHINNLEFMQIDIDADTLSDIEADILREMENGTGGSLFE